MFHYPTAAVNLFHVGKQYLTFCKAEAAVTHNLIGRKIISNVKHSDARSSLPILDVIRSSHKRHSASEYCKWTLRQTTDVCYTRIYVLGAPSHFPTEYRHEAAVVSREHRTKWVVISEMVINDHCHGSVDLEPDPCFQIFLNISETNNQIFNCNTFNRRSGQALPFIFFELRAPTCQCGRYDPKTENFTLFYIYLLHIHSFSKNILHPCIELP